MPAWIRTRTTAFDGAERDRLHCHVRGGRWAAFHAWRVWNRTRYFWPQAQARKRAAENLGRAYAELGYAWEPPAPWWWPFFWWPGAEKRAELRPIESLSPLKEKESSGA